MKDVLAAGRQNVLNKYDHHSSLLGRTCEAHAPTEIHTLHVLGKVQLPDIPYREWEKENEKMRNEGRAAAGLHIKKI
jgi:hypothetical protein